MDSIDAGGLRREAEPTDPDAAVFVVPVAEWLSPAQLQVLQERAAEGATVVLAAEEGFTPLDTGLLTRSPAVPVARGRCDIAGLGSLEAIDDVALELIDGSSAGSPQECFTGPRPGASLVQR